MVHENNDFNVSFYIVHPLLATTYTTSQPSTHDAIARRTTLVISHATPRLGVIYGLALRWDDIDKLMKPLLMVCAGMMALSCSVVAVAGPDFYIIEKARAAKHAGQQQAKASESTAGKAPGRIANSVTPRDVVYKHGG